MKTNTLESVQEHATRKKASAMQVIIRLNAVLLSVVWLAALYGAFFIGHSVMLTVLVALTGAVMMALLWWCDRIAGRSQT